MRFSRATPSDAPAIAELRAAAADKLTDDFGHGHWSSHPTETSVQRDLKASHVIVAREGRRVVGALTLQSKKPWAIDVSYFTPCRKPIYLINMAVMPARQRRGVGRSLLDEALRQARAFPANAIRLDAYDAPAGAGGFYAACGFTSRGRKTYRGVPLLYFEFITGASS